MSQGETIQRYLENHQKEIEGAALYRALAENEKQPQRAEVYRKLAAAEEKHAAAWEKKLTEMTAHAFGGEGGGGCGGRGAVRPFLR